MQRRRRLVAFFIGVLVVCGFSQDLAARPTKPDTNFYRVILGDNPGSERMAIDELIYGAKVLYSGDSKQGPTLVEGIVWHSNPDEAKYYMGSKNPTQNYDAKAVQALDDKWGEAELMQAVFPEAFPRTENMKSVLADLGLDPTTMNRSELADGLVRALRERYPQGFFIKPVAGFNSDGKFPTDKTDFRALYEGYVENVKAKRAELLKTLGDATEVHLTLKKEKYYEGNILDQLFDAPETVIIQERLKPRFLAPNLIDEYRVHIAEGKVIPGATVYRWASNGFYTRRDMREVERFVERVLRLLPPDMQSLCYGIDVMRLEDGGFKVIELNPGGESGYLYPEMDIWITQAVAAYYRGEPTELQRQVRRMLNEPDLVRKGSLLKDILEQPGVKEIASADPDSISEILRLAKDSFVKALARNDTPANRKQVEQALMEFKLKPFLSVKEQVFIGGRQATSLSAVAKCEALLTGAAVTY